MRKKFNKSNIQDMKNRIICIVNKTLSFSFIRTISKDYFSDKYFDKDYFDKDYFYK